ncbi:MAG: DUF4147 domain-containing protein [Solirubrobacterales bacterium]|nr:DUF4147 domain-containing protein [Solirubrobacterales bacterium]HRV60215.1 DUF4147 domain-containing protein [Solirubrobacterales bacterium]
MTSFDFEGLAGHGQSELRGKALGIAAAGLTAADGADAVRRTVREVAEGVEIGGNLYRLDPGSRLIVLGGGKATMPVALALEEILGDRIDAGAVVLQRGRKAGLDRLEVMYADHPLPSPDSVLAAERMVELAGEARQGDLFITCFTGGRSALLCLPPSEVGFEDKRRLNELLLASGMPITAINTVRKHVSRIKGGRLAARIAPARIVNLTVSDVAGDPLDVLADLTTPDSSTPGDAINVLGNYGLLGKVPASVAMHLESEQAASPLLDGQPIETVMLVNGESVCEAMAGAALNRGLDPVIVGTCLEGEAVEVGEQLARLAVESPPGTALIGCGGESTVTLGESAFGAGGPNQEVALAAARSLGGHAAAGVFLDTDGSDGGSTSAGATCDGETAERAHEADLDLDRALAAHASSEPLSALGDLVETGPTGTNVNDLFVIVTGEGSTGK